MFHLSVCLSVTHLFVAVEITTLLNEHNNLRNYGNIYFEILKMIFLMSHLLLGVKFSIYRGLSQIFFDPVSFDIANRTQFRIEFKSEFQKSAKQGLSIL